MSQRRKILGALGEKLAAGFLTRQGYLIEERNVRTPLGEIDIVAREGNDLVFVEVRTKRSDAFGTPEESINRAKQRKLATLANEYVQRFEEEVPYRIDVVAVELSRAGAVKRIEVIKNAVGECE